jgi:hypothetical protein
MASLLSIESEKESEKQGRSVSPRVMAAGGCGCLFLLCAVLFGGSAFATSKGWISINLLATPTPTATLTPVPTFTPTPTPTARPTATPSPSPTPTTIPASFGPIRFAPAVLLADNAPADTLDRFPSGITLLYATFTYAGMRAGTKYRAEWLLNSTVQPELGVSESWTSANAGNWWVNISNSRGIVAGEYQLNLYLEERLVQSGKTTVEAAALGQPDFTPIMFASDKDALDKPVNPAAMNNPKLPLGTKQIYAFFTAVNVAKGTQFGTEWLLNGQPYIDKKTGPWNYTPTEDYFNYVYNKDGTALAAGTYELKVWLGPRLVKIAAVTIPSK